MKKPFAPLPSGWIRLHVVVWDLVLKGPWEWWLYGQLCTYRWMHSRPTAGGKPSAIRFSIETLARMYTKAKGGSRPKIGSKATKRPRTEGGNAERAARNIGAALRSLVAKGVVTAPRIFREGHKSTYYVHLKDGLKAKEMLARHKMTAFEYVSGRTEHITTDKIDG